MLEMIAKELEEKTKYLVISSSTDKTLYYIKNINQNRYLGHMSLVDQTIISTNSNTATFIDLNNPNIDIIEEICKVVDIKKYL